MILKQKLHLKIAFLPSPFTMVFGHGWKIKNSYTIYSKYIDCIQNAFNLPINPTTR